MQSESSFTSESKEVIGHIVGISKGCGLWSYFYLLPLPAKSLLPIPKLSFIADYCVFIRRIDGGYFIVSYVAQLFM